MGKPCDNRLSGTSASGGGMTLVLVLALLALLSAIALLMLAGTGQRSDEAALLAEETRLEALVLGGLQLGRAALWQDQSRNNFDSFFDVWNTLDPQKIQALAADTDTRLTVAVADLSGRLKVNALGRRAGQRADSPAGAHFSGQTGLSVRDEALALQRYRALWRRFLASGRFAITEAEIEPLLDALADWVDKDMDERPLGAEDGWYMARQPAIVPRNAPLRTLAELLFVRGMTEALLYGDGEHEGLAAYITVAGDEPTLNPNTAPLPVMRALLPGLSEEAAQALHEFRTQPENRAALADPGWVKGVPGLPADLGGELPFFTTQSHWFLVRVTCEKNGLNRTGTATVERLDSGGQNLVSWQLE